MSVSRGYDRCDGFVGHDREPCSAKASHFGDYGRLCPRCYDFIADCTRRRPRPISGAHVPMPAPTEPTPVKRGTENLL